MTHQVVVSPQTIAMAACNLNAEIPKGKKKKKKKNGIKTSIHFLKLLSERNLCQ